ncbi:MAG: ribbon-helix-helix protein, CopG family [Solirubrobacteraceae bacterium]
MSVRLSPALLGRLDELASARRLSRSAMLRALVAEAAVARADEVPGERELLAITAEKARSGNMSAVELLLDREARRDPAEAAFEAEFGARVDAE